MVYRRPAGFTIVELLVVIGIVGVVLGLILPAVQHARESANRVRCLSNLRQIGIALHGFHDLHGQFPPLPTRQPSSNVYPPPLPGDPNELLSWLALILPQMDQDSLYQQSIFACSVNTDVKVNPPHVGFATVIKPYVCPADARLYEPQTDQFGFKAAFTSYVGIEGTLPPGASIGLAGVLGMGSISRLSTITDGSSQTVMVGERPPPAMLEAGWWYPGFIGNSQAGFALGPHNMLVLGGGPFAFDPCDIIGIGFGPGSLENACDRYHAWSLHPGGANWLFADGSARFLSYAAADIIFALGSKSGGEIVELP
jgi:prepilin-type processing-associated H-X9-DG protein/prepilin-type N-terminal cleavage/methylation domain-containing protein